MKVVIFELKQLNLGNGGGEGTCKNISLFFSAVDINFGSEQVDTKLCFNSEHLSLQIDIGRHLVYPNFS